MVDKTKDFWTRKRTTQCAKCGKTIKVDVVSVYRKGSYEKELLYVARCDRCRRTVYLDSEEVM